ncbi:hypothetical protein AB0H34_05700 [Saccharopolyspora shandongensis]|uniref:hypothetical protein n=1 Tax=Saccharopolyspora shandongensis TaxID=418495 RepID=UPI0034001072
MADRRIGGAGGGSDPAPRKGNAGSVVVAGTLAFALASGSGAMSAGSSVTVGSVAGESAVSGSANTMARNATSRNLKAHRTDAKRSVRQGRADDAWQRMGLRRLRQSGKIPAVDCVVHSFGEVREFLIRTPCKSLDRIVFVVSDDQGNAAVVSVAWVEFRNRSTVWKFQRLEDRHGTGDIRPLGSSLLGMHDIEFTGHHYNAEPRGTTLTIAEAETISGTYSADDLDTITEVAALLPRP